MLMIHFYSTDLIIPVHFVDSTDAAHKVTNLASANTTYQGVQTARNTDTNEYNSHDVSLILAATDIHCKMPRSNDQLPALK